MIFDTAKLEDTNTRLMYQLEVCNRLASLKESDDIEERWSNFKDVVYTAAESITGRLRGTRKEQWTSNELWTITDKRKRAKLKQVVSDDMTAALGKI